MAALRDSKMEKKDLNQSDPMIEDMLCETIQDLHKSTLSDW